MKKLLSILLLACTFSLQAAETNLIKGTLNIQYNTRKSATPVKGVKDVYTLDVNVCNSAKFHGTISGTPQIIEGMFSKSITQPRSLSYDISCDVINPKNITQVRNVGRMFGSVPIASDGVYQYDKGDLELAVIPMGSSGGSGKEGRFLGNTQGRPMGRPANWFEKATMNAVSITRVVKGQPSKVVLTKYDKMVFQQFTMGAGPVMIYQPVTVNGEMLYDYNKMCWHFNNVTLQYVVGNVIKVDRLAGTILWVKSPGYDRNGESVYQFDIRVNEPLATEETALNTKVSDESAVWEDDPGIPALVGTMKYKDTMVNGVTYSSVVEIDLRGNSLNKQQIMALFKVVMFGTLVPLNSD